MTPPPVQTRRALVAATAALATAPVVTARNRKKKRKGKKPPVPLAHAVVLVSQVEVTLEGALMIDATGYVEHAASGTVLPIADTMEVAFATAREDIIAQMQLRAANALAANPANAVPAGRIAVTLF